MSNLSSLKNVPNPFQPDNLGKAWKLLREPFSLAILASVGVHGLIAFGLPWLAASDSKSAQDQRTVQVVELSPLEQARLPQPTLRQPFNPLPKTSKSKLVDPLTSGLALTPPAPLDAMPYYKIPEIIPSTSSYGPTIITIKQSRPKVTKAEPDKSTATKPDKEPAKTETKTPENTSDKKPDDGSDKPSTSAAELKNPSGDPTQAQTPEAKAIALKQRFTYSETGTSDKDSIDNMKAFSQAVTEKLKIDITDWEKPSPLIATYPKEACQFKNSKGEPLKGTPWVGAIVQPDGKLAAKPVLLRSSGFKGLDEAALEYVATQKKFEPSKQPKGYYFPVKLEPAASDCTATDTEKPAS